MSNGSVAVTTTMGMPGAVRMNVFRYRAARADGVVESGRLDAVDVHVARRQLIDAGLYPITIESDGARVFHQSPVPVRDLALGLRVLGDLLEAGLPIGRALRAFQELAPRSWLPALPHLQQQVREGSGLARALQTSPIAVPPVVIGITQAGEASGSAGPAVRRAAELMESAAATRAALQAALTYPAILAVAGVASIGVLVGVVLPTFATMLADLNQQLPPATRIVLTGSRVARQLALPGGAALVTAFITWRAWVGTESGRLRWHEALRRVPLVGTARRSASASRAALSLSVLLDSGIPVIEALRFAGRSAGDAAMERRLTIASIDIAAGRSLSAAFKASDALTPTAVQLLRAGEESGRVSGMLAHAARLDQEQSQRITQTAVRALEPALIFTFAAIVALVAAALLQAVYSVRPTA
ncbi:MAG: Type secretion system protein [Gemmatimonadetes bacterium]|nr:Type secretion system protein [Gemmatimonadota bacterium]